MAAALALSLALHAGAVLWMATRERALAAPAGPAAVAVRLLAEPAGAGAPSAPAEERERRRAAPRPPPARALRSARPARAAVRTTRPSVAAPPPRSAPGPGETSSAVAPDPAAPEAGSAAGRARPGTGAEGPVAGALPRGGYQVRPRYPARARRLGIEGRALLLVRIAPDGRVAELRVADSAGAEELDRAALEAVRRWRFEPLSADRWVRIPIDFRIR